MMDKNIRSAGVQTAIKNLEYVTGGSHDHSGLVKLAGDVVQLCRTEQRFTRQLRGQLGAIFEKYESPDHLYNAAVVLDLVREKCPALVDGIPPKLASAIQSVEMFKPDVGRYNDLISIFSEVCTQTGYHKTALEILVPLLLVTKGTEEGIVFAQFQHHMGVKDPARLALVAYAFGIRARQEEQLGNTDRANSWSTRQRAICTQISGLDAVA